MRKFNLIKKLLCCTLAVAVFIGYMPVDAWANTISVESNNNAQLEKFKSMTNDELNQFITNVMLSYEANSNSTSGNAVAYGTTVPQGTLEQAWYAAAQVARNLGYTCAAKLVECSVDGQAYIENSYGSGTGLFTDKIKASSKYNTFLTSARGKTSKTDLVTFDSGDLFYALHNCTFQSTGNMPGSIFATYTINVTDTFDFAYDNDYNSLFSSAVNNWGWLCQQAGVLKKIPVKITMLDK